MQYIIKDIKIKRRKLPLKRGFPAFFEDLAENIIIYAKILEFLREII